MLFDVLYVIIIGGIFLTGTIILQFSGTQSWVTYVPAYGTKHQQAEWILLLV